MDPITGAVVAIVIWLVLISVGWVLAYFGGVAVGVIAGRTEGSIALGALIGWIVGGAWGIFAAIQAILQIVHLIQLIIGG